MSEYIRTNKFDTNECLNIFVKEKFIRTNVRIYIRDQYIRIFEYIRHILICLTFLHCSFNQMCPQIVCMSGGIVTLVAFVWLFSTVHLSVSYGILSLFSCTCSGSSVGISTTVRNFCMWTLCTWKLTHSLVDLLEENHCLGFHIHSFTFTYHFSMFLASPDALEVIVVTY